MEFPELKHRSEKLEAFENLQRNNVPTVLEDVLNKICRIKPDDMYGYLVRTVSSKHTVLLNHLFSPYSV